jgi:hypothetical protein
VAFGEAVRQGVLPVALVNQLYVMVALSMAAVPYLAALGSKLGTMFEKGDLQVRGWWCWCCWWWRWWGVLVGCCAGALLLLLRWCGY